jgi:pyruvate/2-oxoglutarate/acetoin dehydrogenase E1 component
MDFLMLGLDPLHFAAKARFKTGGQLRVPMVVKPRPGRRPGVARSQCRRIWLMGVQA